MSCLGTFWGLGGEAMGEFGKADQIGGRLGIADSL
jgi:hypothetical protein